MEIFALPMQSCKPSTVLQELCDLFIGDLTACPLSSEIVSLFQSEGKTSVSVTTVLELVSVLSNKLYLSNGKQQDSEEFLTALFTELKWELWDVDDSIFKLFYGKEKIVRKFLHTADGNCHRCKKVGRVDDEEFLTLKLTIPVSSEPIPLSHLTRDYFGEQTTQFFMKCSNCCKCVANCPLTGQCKQLPAVMENHLIRSSQLLFIQLKRFKPVDKTKILTKIVPELMLELPSCHKYSLEVVLSHHGTVSTAGHFTTMVKDKESWISCNDSSCKRIDESKVKSASSENYIFIYRKLSEDHQRQFFEPSNIWKEVPVWQSIPPGCVGDLNLKTGKLYAKIDENYKKPDCLNKVSPTQQSNAGRENNNPRNVRPSTRSQQATAQYQYRPDSRNKESTSSGKKESTNLINDDCTNLRNEDSTHLRNEEGTNGRNQEETSMRNREATDIRNEEETNVRKQKSTSLARNDDMLVEPSFTGIKKFNSYFRFPNNDGWTWQSFKKKIKGQNRFKCTECSAQKLKYKSKDQLKQTKHDMQQRPITVKYEVPHSCNGQPTFENICDSRITQKDERRNKIESKKEIHPQKEGCRLDNETEVSSPKEGDRIIDETEINLSKEVDKIGNETETIPQTEGDQEIFTDADYFYDINVPVVVEQEIEANNSKNVASPHSVGTSKDIDWFPDEWFPEEELASIEGIRRDSLPINGMQLTSKEHISETEMEDAGNKSILTDADIIINNNGKRPNDQVYIDEFENKKKKVTKGKRKNEESNLQKEKMDEIKVLRISGIEEIVENVVEGTAYLIPGAKTKPKISRINFKWGPNQPGRKGLSSYKCTGSSFRCQNCDVPCSKNLDKCSQCLGPFKEIHCRASKYMFYCDGNCNRKIWNNPCCESKEEKLVIFYPSPHSCDVKNKYCEVKNENDILLNMNVFNESEENIYDVKVLKKLPFDISGNQLCLISLADGDTNIENMVKDGRRYKKSLKTNNSVFNNIFGKNMENKVRLYKCRGTNYCFNSECSFLKRFEAINQVQFDVKQGEKYCVSCGEMMHSINCEARKYIAHDERFIVVKHMGTHECPARSTYETEIVAEIENYFAINGLSTPFQAVVNHLNQKLDLENAEEAIQDLVKLSLKKWTIKNAKRKVIKRQNPYGPTLQAARMIKTKLVENAKNPYRIEIQIAEDSYVCAQCSFISEQSIPGQDMVKNCPSASCNLQPMEKAGPYVFLTSEEGLKTLRDLNNGGLLENEALHFDFQPSRINQHTCLAAYCYDLDLRSMAPLFSAILTKETEMSVFVILELVKKNMREKIDCEFDPALYMADEAACLKNAVVREHGPSKLEAYGTCELHYMKSVFQHCTNELGSQQKQFEHLKFAEGLMNAATPAIYDVLYISYKKWIEDRPGRIACLKEFLDWWHSRRCGWSKAFRNSQLPRTNLAEVGNAKFSSRSGMTKLSLDMGMKALISEHQQYSAKKRGVINGDYMVGSGRSRINLEEKQIKELFKRVEETPIDESEESKIIKDILEKILGSGIGITIPEDTIDEHRDIFMDNVIGKEQAFRDSPSNKDAIHRPPNRQKITPAKRAAPKSGRININLKTPRESLQCTMTSSLQRRLFTTEERRQNKDENPKVKSTRTHGESIIKRAFNTFNQLINVEQFEVGKFRLHIRKKELEIVIYETQIIGRFSCLCEDFKRKNRNSLIDQILCKHFLYVLFVIGVDPLTQRSLLAKCSSSHFSEEDMSVIYKKCTDFDSSLCFLHFETLYHNLEETLSKSPAKRMTDLDIRLKQQKPLPYINEVRLYGKYRSKNEAMEDILTNTDRFIVTWYILIAPDGRRQCPGAGTHDKKCIQRGQLCLAADFNSVMLKRNEGEPIYRLKDQRRFFCLQKECTSIFTKRELRDFSNIKTPMVVSGDYIQAGSSEELQFLVAFPTVTLRKTVSFE